MKLLIITQKVNENDQLLGFFIDWIIEFTKYFSHIEIICLERGDYTLPDTVHVTSLGKDQGISKIGQLFNFYKTIFIAHAKYDAVFVHMNPIWVVLGSWYWHLTRKKVILWYTHKAVTMKLRVAAFFADIILTASRESFRLASKNVMVTGHGINTDLFKPSLTKSQSDTLCILTVGRIAPVKNYEVLITAAKILKERNIHFQVTIAGEPGLLKDQRYESAVRQKVADYHLENNVYFSGKISYRSLPGLYQRNRIFVHMSKTGSLDKTILEAMACGLTVVSSNDSSRSFLPEELIFPEDNAQKLAECILYASQHLHPMRQYVLDNHGLKPLISRISNILKS